MIDLFANFIDNIKNFGLEKVFGRYYSIYRAQVVSNADPEMRGRITVKIPVLFGELELPNMALPRDMRGAGFAKGEFYPPDIDDWVFVEFESGMLEHPVYSGGWHGETEENGAELPTEFAYDAETDPENPTPNRRGYKDSSGNRIIFDSTLEKQKVSLVASDGAETPQEISLEMSLEKDKAITKLSTLSHFFVLDDTKDKEGIFLIHKTGTQLQIDAKGSFKIITKGGHLVSLNEEDKTVMVLSQDGSIVSLKDNIVIADSSGKSTVTISKDTIQLTTAKDLVMQANTATIKSGAMTLDGGSAKVALGNMKIALGTASCEIVDTMIKIIEAFLNDPVLTSSPAGPCSGLIGTAKVDLTLLKVKLNLIKGSL